ncbi:MAG: hypothetical protein JXA25_16795, partial [Anaerolineales bacterium]|nr:hypothetical protein [Anaerolineales bacterium]
LTGALAGAMALTKAVFLYVGLGLAAALLVVFMVKQSRPDRRRFLKLTGVLVLSTAAVILPWMLRNRVLLGTWSVSGRGGSVLNIRAVKNQMNDTEYAGAFYYYAPPALQARIGNWLGFDEADLEEGGSLQRLNRAGDSDFGPRDLEAERAGRPEDAISFYRSARAEKVRLEMYYAEQGAENPSLLAEDTLQHRAMRMILSDPVKHLKTTLVFLWRGMWVEVRFRYIVAGFAAIWIMGLWGLLRRNSEMLGIALPSLGVYLFHGLFSHFIPRYSMILVPNMMIAMIVGAIWLCVFTINRYHSWVEARMSNQRNTAGKN